MKSYFIHKGKQFESINDLPSELFFHAFKYGDGAFETMLVENGEIKLLSYHYDRINQTFKALGYDELKIISPADLLKSVPKQGKYRVKLTYFRSGEAFYYSKSLATESLIEVSEVIHKESKIFELGVYEQALKSYSILSPLKLTNCSVYVEASRYKTLSSLDDVIVLNNKGQVCETSFCNIFMVKNDQIFTPSIYSGCVAGTMRAFLLDNIEVIEKEISVEDLFSADEIFLTNALRGIIPARLIEKQVNHKAFQLQNNLLSI